jgi:tetratricopeptide (TPR) repeat protein
MRRSSSDTARQFLPVRRLGVLVLTVFLSCGMVAVAQEEEESLGDMETQETASMTEATYKEMAKAQEAAEAENWAEANRVLDKLSKQKLNDYERAQMLNLQAYIYYGQDRIGQAVQAYEQLLQLPGLPEALRTSTVYTLSQLYFSQEKWQRSITMLERWMELTSEESLTAFEMMAQAYYQMEEYRKAMRPAYKVVQMKQAAGEPVPEHTYMLLRVLHYELGEYQQVTEILHDLIRISPKREYWMQLASIYGEMEDQRRQLNTLQLMYMQGMLNQEKEVMSLIGLLLNNELYVRAGRIIEENIQSGMIPSTYENWRLAAQAWTMAQEDELAIPALTRSTELAPDGKMHIILGNTYMNLGRWEEAVNAAQAAIRKGGLDREDQAHVMIGQALFELERFDEARTAFEAAARDRRSRQLAAQWINYIENEKDRQAQLSAALE